MCPTGLAWTCDGVLAGWKLKHKTSIAPPEFLIRAAQSRERTLSVTTLAMKGEFHAPSLEHEFFPGHVNGDLWFNDFAGGAFALDRLMIIRIVMILLVSAFFFFAMRKPKLIPSGVQNFAELALDFVRIHIAEDILGKKEGRRFLPIITAIFFTVLAVNLPTIIPGLNISPSARFGLPLVLALIAYVVFIYAGVKRYGFGKYIKSSLVIPGLPPFLHLLVVPIEFVSTFILRPATLAIRLMANMLAGHLILVMLFAATNFFFWQMNGWTLAAAGTLIFGVAFSFFEIMVIFLQAYIFALLTAVYIELSLHADEH